MISYNSFVKLYSFWWFWQSSIVHLYKHHENERDSQKRLLCDPDFIHNYFLLLKRMFDFFNNRNKCHKPGFLRGNIYTSCISMVLLDHLQTKATLFDTHSLSLPFSLSHFLPFLPWAPLPPTQDTRIPQLKVPWLHVVAKSCQTTNILWAGTFHRTKVKSN